MNIILISELVDSSGSKIKGDIKINQDDNATSSKYTTDDVVNSTRQKGSVFYNYGRIFYGENDENNSKVKNKKSKRNNKKLVKEFGKNNTINIIEDIFTKKDFDREFVNKSVDYQKLNGIPKIDDIKETNPIIIRKVSALKDIIEKNNTSGEEKAIILNYLLGIDLSDIPKEFKNELIKKLNV